MSDSRRIRLALPAAVRLPRLERAVAKLSPGNGSQCTLALYSAVVENPFLIKEPRLQSAWL